MTFAIEAPLLVDHYNFLDRFATPPKAKAPTAPKTPKSVTRKALAAISATKQTAAKKTAGKEPAARKAALKKRTGKKATAKAKSPGRRAKVTEIAQSLEKAATKAGIFLYTNDAWSLRYLDPNDLHSLERKLFG